MYNNLQFQVTCVRDEMEEGGQHGAQQRPVEGGHTVVHHGQGVQAQAVVSGGGYQAWTGQLGL